VSPHDGPVRAFAPGRVNLIGDHTDHMGGPVLPMAIQLGTTVTGVRGGGRVELTSDLLDGEVRLDLPVREPAAVAPAWGRYVAGVAAQLGTTIGLSGRVTSDLPAGAGLSSSAALEVAVALALGGDEVAADPVSLARTCQAAEQAATGVPCGIMDQLASVAGVEGHALLIDCSTLAVTPVPIPDHARIWVVHSGQDRALDGSAYAERRAECERARDELGHLPGADPDAVERLDDPVVRARARHVRSESARVHELAAALRAGDLRTAGALMVASHRSLREDFEVSTPALDATVDRLLATPGVHGARLTGAGFGGCVVALTDPEVQLDGWRVDASAGARLLEP